MSKKPVTDLSESGKERTKSSLPPPPTPFSRQERQIAPGVYFSPPPSALSSSNAPNSAQSPLDELSLPQLRRERDELMHSITHLVASNKEMVAIDPDQLDFDLVQAITENAVIITKRQQRVNEITQKLPRLGDNCDSKCLATSKEQVENSVFLDLDAGMYL